MTEIMPAVLARSGTELSSKVDSLPTEAKFIHLDVLIDDVWTPIDREFEAHLMVPNPSLLASLWVERGAKRIIAHTVGGLEKKDVEIGLAIEMHLPIEQMHDEIKKADFVQLMAIDEIGEQGHPLNPIIFDRIKEVKEKFPDKIISIDGGINASNYQQLIEAGASRLAVGTAFEEVWSQMKKS